MADVKCQSAQIGADEQAACGNHLNSVCRAMAHAEDRQNVALTVRSA